MYDFYYNFIKKNFDANLLFINTDNITYKIKSKDDVYEKHKHLFDCSEQQSKNFDPTNKINIHKMKDECKGVPIDEFDALKSKI